MKKEKGFTPLEKATNEKGVRSKAIISNNLMASSTCPVRKKSLTGFTLVELLMVIVILGILLSILLPRFVLARYKALYSACIFNERSIVTSLESYRAADPGKEYPVTGNLDILQEEGFINQISLCPTTNAVYGYERSDDSAFYTITCTGNHSLLNKKPPVFDSSTGEFILEDL